LRALAGLDILIFLDLGPGLTGFSHERVEVTNQDTEFHSPQREAAIFYGMFLRGHSADELREEIDISPKLFAKWMRAREFDITFRENLRRIYTYRKQVLAIFDSLVTSDKTNQNWQ
jgi:hypothetical protein